MQTAKQTGCIIFCTLAFANSETLYKAAYKTSSAKYWLNMWFDCGQLFDN